MMNFGQAIEALKRGKHVARAGWNGKGMGLTLSPVFGDRREHIDLLDAERRIVPWTPSQTDVLAEDWVEVRIPRGAVGESPGPAIPLSESTDSIESVG